MNPRRLRIPLACLLATLGAFTAHAEVSTDRAGAGRVTTLLMDQQTSITDGADPIPQLRWVPYRRLPDTRLLNRTGVLRRDGRPDVGYYPMIHWPVVVWAWNNDTDHDIALAEWTPEGWSETRFLTAERIDEVDPRIFVDRDAGLHIVWSVAGDDPHVVYLHRRGRDTWMPPVRVTAVGERARRPTVATVGGMLFVAYEVARELEGQTVNAVAVRLLRDAVDGTLPTFDVVRVFPTPRLGDLQPVLHVRGGRLWLDWKHADGFFGFSVFENREWSTVHLQPWIDPSWIGEEDTRLSIQYRVLFPKIPDPLQ